MSGSAHAGCELISERLLTLRLVKVGIRLRARTKMNMRPRWRRALAQRRARRREHPTTAGPLMPNTPNGPPPGGGKNTGSLRPMKEGAVDPPG